MRRTRQQIKEDAAKAKVVADADVAEHSALLRRIAELEKAVDLEEQDQRMHANRPDVAHGPPRTRRLTLKLPRRESR